MKMTNQNKITIAVVLSLALHALVVIVLWLNPDLSLPNKKQTKTVEVELMSPEELAKALKAASKDPNGQIVEQDHQVNDEIADDAKYLSKHNQKVVRETQAALQGKFKNTTSSNGDPSPKQAPGKVEPSTEKKEKQQEIAKEEKTPETTEKPREILTAENGVTGSKKKPALKDLIPKFRSGPPPVDATDIATGGGQGPSATDDSLKNVTKGMQTLLSTREFVYYSYYNRIKDKLRQYWQPKIREKMERIMRQGRTIASDADKITRIVIVLNGEGTLVRVQVIGPSGVNDLDDAAVEAFRAAAPFPNPPKGIADQDGMIKIRWDFILEANSGGGLLDALMEPKKVI